MTSMTSRAAAYKTTSTLALALALAFAGTPAAAAGDPAAGQRKMQVCQACHGADGNSPSAQFPRLAGQHADYLIKALQDYKSGARKNPIMQGFAAPLSERDMQDLAAYFSRQPGLNMLPDPGPNF